MTEEKAIKANNRLLSRRETIRLLSTAGGTALFGWGANSAHGALPTPELPAVVSAADTIHTPSGAMLPAPLRGTGTAGQQGCVVTPAQTQGPFYVDERLFRSDIRADAETGVLKAGVPLRLRFNLFQANSTAACTPIPGAKIEIWHADAFGIYSGVNPTLQNPDTLGQRWLRGYQVTDAMGSVEFLTNYPGWYVARAIHIHFKIQLNTGYSWIRENLQFVSQVYFDDALTDQVFNTFAPYNTRGPRPLRNNTDFEYTNTPGSSLLVLNVVPDPRGGFSAVYNIGVSLDLPPGLVSSILSVSAANTQPGTIVKGSPASVFGSNSRPECSRPSRHRAGGRTCRTFWAERKFGCAIRSGKITALLSCLPHPVKSTLWFRHRCAAVARWSSHCLTTTSPVRERRSSSDKTDIVLASDVVKPGMSSRNERVSLMRNMPKSARRSNVALSKASRYGRKITDLR
jgi:protocatechuate 3,4-dioxygenase beta subunit